MNYYTDRHRLRIFVIISWTLITYLWHSSPLSDTRHLSLKLPFLIPKFILLITTNKSLNYLKAKIAIIIQAFIMFVIIFHNVTPNSNLNIIYCKDPIIPLSIISLKCKVDSISSIYETKRNWTKVYNIAFLSESSGKCILWD